MTDAGLRAAYKASRSLPVFAFSFSFRFSKGLYMKKMRLRLLILLSALALVFAFAACSNPSGSDGGAGKTPAAGSTIISIDTIPGVTPPAFGETPVTTVAETAQYTGTVTWNPLHTSFAKETVYTATINLTAKSGFTFQGVSKDFFTVAGATSVNNSVNSGTVTVVFPATGSAPPDPISIKAITGLIVPVTGESPVTTIDETLQFTGIVIWNPDDTVFKASTEYTAEIHLTAKTGYTLQGVPADFFTVTGATAMSNAADSGVITAVFPATDAPVYFSGNGTSGNPYQIATAAQLAKLAELVNAGNKDYNNKNYILTANIDLSAYGSGFNNGKGWIPIGTMSYAFGGTFAGNGKKITGLYINDSNSYYAALFGYLSGATITNLGVENVNITGMRAGGIVAYSTITGFQITNCYTTGSISGTSMVGGIAPYSWSNGTIINCYSTASVSLTGNDTGTRDCAGGIVGELQGGSIINCYSTGAISGTNNNSYVAIGGIVGRVEVSCSVSNCAALNPSITTVAGTAGRVVGSNAGTLSNNYARNDMTVNGILINSTSGSDINGISKSINEILTYSTYSSSSNLGWQFGNDDDHPWKWDENSAALLVFYWQ